MYVYLIIYALVATFAYFAERRENSRSLAYAFSVFIVFFAGTREEVGCDYDAYLGRFLYSYHDMTLRDAFNSGEGGFHLLNIGVHELGYTFSSLLLVCAVLYVFGLTRFAHLAARPLSLLALSFPVLILQLGMSGLRQALATAFLMNAWCSFVKKQRIGVLVWVVIATQFHTSAIIFLPVVLLVGRKISSVQLALAVLLIGPIVAVLLENRLEVYDDRYVTQIYGEQSSSGAWFRYVLTLVPFALFTWQWRPVKNNFPELFELIRLFTYVAFALAPAGAISSVALHRLTFYVMPVSLLTLLCVSESMFDPQSEKLGTAIPFIAYGAYITVWFTQSAHAASCYVPYNSWIL